jgi:hypothetical protein
MDTLMTEALVIIKQIEIKDYLVLPPTHLDRGGRGSMGEGARRMVLV